MNMERANFLFLGTGGSAGIPMIGCECPVCTSSDPHNHRLRPSGLVTVGEKRFLIDVGPDFRFQALKHKITHLDGVLLTHSHFDHVAGLDELRIYYLHHKKALPVLVSESTLGTLKQRYDYFFRERSWGTSLAAQLDFHLMEGERGEVDFLGTKIGFTSYEQGGMAVNGYRFGTFAYISDIRHYPETIFSDLAGVEILVLSALHNKPSHMHFTIDEAIDFSQKVGARQTYLTHIAHNLDHEQTNATLPTGVELAYDGLQVEISA